MNKIKLYNILIILVIVLILLIIGIIFLDFYGLNNVITGEVINQDTKNIEFTFIDNYTNCSLNGEIYIEDQFIGNSIYGRFNISQDDYYNLVNDITILTIKGITDSCFNENSGLPFSESWYLPKPADSSLIFKTTLSPRKPRNYNEMQGYIRPYEVKDYLISINEENSTDVGEIIDELSEYKIRYRSDMLLFNKQEYWQTPKETLVNGHGDCEDWAVTVLSLIRGYNNKLQCYDIVWDTHISIFCYINSEYIIYDQDKTKFSRKLDSSTGDLENKAFLRKMRNDYFDRYGIKPNERNVHALFNEKEMIVFDDNEDFIDWAYELSK